MTIRPATIDDAAPSPRCTSRRGWPPTAGWSPTSVLDAQSVDARAAQWDEWLRKGETRTLVAGGVDGFVTFWETTGKIAALYVAPDRGRRGIGSALLDGAHAALHAAGHDEASLWVLEANAPRARVLCAPRLHRRRRADGAQADLRARDPAVPPA